MVTMLVWLRAAAAGPHGRSVRASRDVHVADEHLDRDHPPEDGVVGDVDRAHPAARELALDLVATDLRARLDIGAPVMLEGEVTIRPLDRDRAVGA